MSLSAAEQLLLELVNRARLDPLGEAARYGIDLNKDLTPGTLTGTAKQVLAPNALLEQAAHDFSVWLMNNNLFQHEGPGGNKPWDRMDDVGYEWWTAGENLSRRSELPGPIDGDAAILSHHRGLFLSSGHRKNILNDNFRELGIGQHIGWFELTDSEGRTRDWSTSIVTEKFGSSGSDIFLTGVVYADTDFDGFYSIGEGQANVQVAVEGSAPVSSAQAGGYKVAQASGTGWIDVLLNGTAHVRVDMNGINTKLDLVDGTRVESSGDLELSFGIDEAALLGVADLTLTGTDAGELLEGNRGANAITARGGNDSVAAGEGDDTVDGGAGRDLVEGGAGRDVLQGDAGFDTLRGGDGDDTLDGGGHGDRLFGEDGDDSLDGGWGWDHLDGGTGDDILSGGTGQDSLNGGLGADTLSGGAHDDVLQGGGHADVLRGDDGDDRLGGQWGNDDLGGGDGDDWLEGHSGADTLSGDLGADTLSGGNHDDVLDGGGHSDVMNGDDGNDTLLGRWGDDDMSGGDGDDALHGHHGADILRGDGGDDTLSGGAHGDTFAFHFASGPTGADTITDFTAADTIRFVDPLGEAGTFAAFLAATDQVGANAVYDFGDDGVNTITLIGVDRASLTQGQFDFVVTA